MRCLDGITDSMDISFSKLWFGDGPGALACCGQWCCKDSDTTDWLTWTELHLTLPEIYHFPQVWNKVKFKVTQSCLTLCDLMDYKVHGILQARILEWAIFPFSRGSSQPRDWTQVSTLQADFLPAELYIYIYTHIHKQVNDYTFHIEILDYPYVFLS